MYIKLAATSKIGEGNIYNQNGPLPINEGKRCKTKSSGEDKKGVF